MLNELIFLLQTSAIASGALIALRLGKEALVAFITLLCVLANIFVLKQITLFGLEVTAADAFSVGVILSLHLLQEFFGKKISKRAIWICFFTMAFYTITSQVHLLFVPTTHDFSQTHFYALLQFAPRIIFASLTSYLFVLNLDRFLYGKLQAIFGKRYIIIWSFFLLAFIQLVDTVCFSLLGLWGIVQHVSHVMLVSFAVKLIASLFVTPFFWLAQKV